MQWTYRFGVGPVEFVPPLAAHADQANSAQYAQMLRDGRLVNPQLCNDVAYRTFPQRQVGQNLTPARFGYGVKGVGGSGRSWHKKKIHAHIGICQEAQERK